MSESLTPRCKTCGQYLDPNEPNCKHIEESLPHIGVDNHKRMARRLTFMQAQIDLLMDRERHRQHSRKSAAKRRSEQRDASGNG